MKLLHKKSRCFGKHRHFLTNLNQYNKKPTLLHHKYNVSLKLLMLRLCYTYVIDF